jgi:hypothetical protein
VSLAGDKTILTIDTLAAISPGGSHVPPYTVINQHYPCRMAGKVLWSDPDLARDRRFADSPLEGTGFELVVPLRDWYRSRWCQRPRICVAWAFPRVGLRF